MIDEWGGTLTLTEASSRELMRVLKEQDDEFMDNLFNGKCGFTLKCTDGRSVELVPKADRKTEPQMGTEAERQYRLLKEVADEAWNKYEANKVEDEPQTERSE